MLLASLLLLLFLILATRYFTFLLMSDAYGFLAPIYQPISRLVFGSDLIYANQAFLAGNSGKKLLIIGGGDGVAYRDFGKNLQGEFWDLSPGMIQLAERNLEGSGLITQGGTWKGTGKFDRVYLPFVLDTMPDDEIDLLIRQLKTCLLEHGEVVISDFFKPVDFQQRMIQQAMIVFFKIIAGHRRKNLPDIIALLKMDGFELIQEKCWRKGWIRAQIWRPT